MKKRFSNSGSKPAKPKQEKEEDSDSAEKVEESKREVKTGRVWHTISNKIDKKSMDKFDLSTQKDEGVDLRAEMEKYLGGDDDVLQGFIDSDDDSLPLFDSINPLKSQEQKSIFGRLVNVV